MFHEFTHAVAPFMWAGMGILWVMMHHRQKMARIAAERGYDPRLRGHHIAEMEAMARHRPPASRAVTMPAKRPAIARTRPRAGTHRHRRRTPRLQPASLARQIDALKD
jgi:hypothetical protein